MSVKNEFTANPFMPLRPVKDLAIQQNFIWLAQQIWASVLSIQTLQPTLGALIVGSGSGWTTLGPGGPTQVLTASGGIPQWASIIPDHEIVARRVDHIGRPAPMYPMGFAPIEMAWRFS